MRARVHHAVTREVVRLELARLPVAPKGELQDAHPRESPAFAQRLDFRGDDTEILRHDGKLAEALGDGGEERVARTLHPCPVDRRRGVARHLPVTLEAAEVVDAHHVEQGEGGAQATDPPLVARGSQRLPVVDGIPPELAGGAEVVGGDAGLHAEAPVLVQLEELAVRPDVGRVVRDVDGEVAHQRDAAIGASLLQGLELAEEVVLLDLEVRDRGGELAPPLVERVGVARRRTLFPRGPEHAAVRLLQRHEQRVVGEPIGVDLDEVVEAVVGLEPREGGFEERELVGNDPLEVDAVRRKITAATPRHVDHERVAGEGREALVRRVAVAGGAEREHLPDLHSRLGEEIEKAVRFRTQFTDAVGAGKRGRVKENACRAGKGHRGG